MQKRCTGPYGALKLKRVFLCYKYRVLFRVKHSATSPKKARAAVFLDAVGETYADAIKARIVADPGQKRKAATMAALFHIIFH